MTTVAHVSAPLVPPPVTTLDAGDELGLVDVPIAWSGEQGSLRERQVPGFAGAPLPSSSAQFAGASLPGGHRPSKAAPPPPPPVSGYSGCFGGCFGGGAASRGPTPFPCWKATHHAGLVAEEELYSAFCRTPVAFRDTPLDAACTTFMHSVEGGPEEGVPLIATAGYAAGSGFFFRNMDALCRGFRVYLVDMLGWGLSSRPDFAPRDLAATEAFFVDALEAWRAARKIEKFILLGHSLGGYIATCYAMRYPHRLHRLVLAGPAGLGARPAELPPGQSWLARIGRWGWEAGITPGVMVRCLGPCGPQFASHYTHTRFDTESIGSRMSRKEKMLFSRYFFQILGDTGSAEFALRFLLAPGAWPRRALLERAGELAVPLSLIYGAKDWIDYRFGERLAESLTARGIHAELQRVPKSAHHVYLDAPQAFNCALLRMLRGLVPEDRRLQVDAEIGAGLALLELEMEDGFTPEDNHLHNM